MKNQAFPIPATPYVNRTPCCRRVSRPRLVLPSVIVDARQQIAVNFVEVQAYVYPVIIVPQFK